MALTEHQRALHANAEKWGIEYPPTAAFAEEHPLSADQARIPTSRYTSPDFLALELELVWKRTWQMACRSDEVAEPGAFVEYRIADQSYLVVRQHDGSVKAFHNVCRHRGNTLRTGCGQLEELRCRYHHWCWTLDGTLAEIPDRHLFDTVNAPLDESEYGLGEISCDEWGGFVMVNPDPDAPPLLDYLGMVAEQLGPYRFEDMAQLTYIETELSCNWKVAVEAFVEVYHVQGIHPQLLPMLDDVNTAFEVMGPHSRMIVPFGVPSMRVDDVAPNEVFEAFLAESGNTATLDPDERDGAGPTSLLQEAMGGHDDVDAAIASIRRFLIDRSRERGVRAGHTYEGLTDSQMLDDWHYLIFPGMVFNTHAGGFLLFRIRPHDRDPDRCLFDIYRFGLPEGGEKPAPVEKIPVPEGGASFGRVLDQDFANLPGVQRGLHSDGLDFCTISAQEVRIAALHAAIDDYLGRPT